MDVGSAIDRVNVSPAAATVVTKGVPGPCALMDGFTAPKKTEDGV